MQRLLLAFLMVFSVAGADQTMKPPPSGPLRDENIQISQYIRRMFQDSAGNLWFGTNDDGVARYDGKKLTYFTRKEGFCGDAVRGILEDKHANVWFATSGGVCRYDGTSFQAITQSDGLASDGVWSLWMDQTGILWIGTDEGVSKYDGKIVTSFPLPALSAKESQETPHSAPKLVNSIYQDPKGNLWFGTNGKGVIRYDGRTIKAFTEADGLCSNFVQTVYGDRSGNLWIGCRVGGLSRYIPKANTFTTFTMSDGLCGNFVWTFLQDRNGTLWIGTAGGGLCSMDKASLSSAKPAFTAYGAKQGLPNRHVQSLLEDKEGRLWVGTSGGAFRSTKDHRLINITRAGPW